MKPKKMDWKAWIALIIIVIIISGIASNINARAEDVLPSDSRAVIEAEMNISSKNETPAEDSEISYNDFITSNTTTNTDAAIVSPLEESISNSTNSSESKEQPASPSETPIINATESPVDMQQPEASMIPPAEESTSTPTIFPTIEPNASPSPPALPTEVPTSEPTFIPEPTENPPVDLKALFDVIIKMPSTWQNSGSASVRIKITPNSNMMWDTVKYRLGDSHWISIKNSEFILYDNYYYTDINVFTNATLCVRLQDQNNAYFDTYEEIRIFDYTAPDVTAGFKDMLLHVEAIDPLSGVAGIQVNSLLFTTLTDGLLDIRMENPLNTFKQLAIRAYDYAGNFSEPVTLDNPYYVAPTPIPTATPNPTVKPTAKPTKRPSGSSSTNATSTPAVTTIPTSSITQQSQIVYASPNPYLHTYTHPITTPEPETVYVPVGPGQPYKSEGNMQTLDMLYSASTNKQFITVQTRAGETYYMVIDYDKPIDESNNIYETYFLNLVDDRDLLSVVSEDEVLPTPTPQIIYVTPEPTPILQQSAPIVVEGDDRGILFPALLMIAGMAAASVAILLMLKKKRADSSQNDSDFNDDEFEFEEDIPDL